MALIVEDGTGKADAESLATVAFFRDYHAKRGNDVTGLSDEVVEQLLRKATDYTVWTYQGAWAGLELFPGVQVMPFPRVPWGPLVPAGIQQAVSELALIAKKTPLIPTVTRGKKRVKVGPLEVEYDGNAATSTKFIAGSLRFAAFLAGVVGGPFAKLIRT